MGLLSAIGSKVLTASSKVLSANLVGKLTTTLQKTALGGKAVTIVQKAANFVAKNVYGVSTSKPVQSAVKAIGSPTGKAAVTVLGAGAAIKSLRSDKTPKPISQTREAMPSSQPPAQPSPPPKEKGIIETIIDTAKEHPIQAALVTAGTVVAGYGVYRGIKAIKSRSKKKKSKSTSRNQTRRSRTSGHRPRFGTKAWMTYIRGLRGRKRSRRRIVRGRGLGYGEINHSRKGTKLVSFRTKDGRIVRFKRKV